jgi:ABC-type amino acid transport substrate-binding protein
MVKKFIFIALMLLPFIILFGNTVVDEHKSLIIGCEPDYPPYCMVNTEGEAEGFSVDLIKAAVSVMGFEYEMKVDIWSKLKRALAKGEIDALPLVGRTPEREPLFDFTFPYITLHGAIFVRQGDHRINSKADLSDKELVVMSGDNAEEYARRVQQLV